MKKINPALWDNRRAAKEYARANGYHGALGGWIYRDDAEPVYRRTREGLADTKRSLYDGKPICQGWHTFYRKYSREIEAHRRAEATKMGRGE